MLDLVVPQRNFNMHRLLFALLGVGAVLACQPLPRPKTSGKGNDTAQVTLVTTLDYDPSKTQDYMEKFSKTKIEEYAEQVGNFKNLSNANEGGKFAFTFTLEDADCEKVKEWADEIRQSSQYFSGSSVMCVHSQATTDPTTTTTEAQTVRIETTDPTTTETQTLRIETTKPALKLETTTAKAKATAEESKAASTEATIRLKPK